MIKTITSLFLALSAHLAEAENLNSQGAYQFIGDKYIVEDIDCMIDSRVEGREDSHCVHEVPELIFKHICTTPSEDYQLNQKRRTCILQGLRA